MKSLRLPQTDAPTFVMPPLAFVVDRAEFDRWMRNAPAGTATVYAHGKVTPSANEVFRHVGALGRAQQLTLTQRVNPDTRETEWIARKRAPAALEAPSAPVLPASIATIEDRVLAELTRAARFGLACPTNAELAKSCGLKLPDDASYRVRKLVEQGLIKVEPQGPTKRRIVTVWGVGTTPGGAL